MSRTLNTIKKKTQKKNRKTKRFKFSLRAKTSPKEKQKTESQPPKTIENNKDNEPEPGYTETVFVYQNNFEAEENALSKILENISDDSNESTKQDKTGKSFQNETPPKNNFFSPTPQINSGSITLFGEESETSNELKNFEAKIGNTLLNQNDKTCISLKPLNFFEINCSKEVIDFEAIRNVCTNHDYKYRINREMSFFDSDIDGSNFFVYNGLNSQISGDYSPTNYKTNGSNDSSQKMESRHSDYIFSPGIEENNNPSSGPS